MKPKPKPKKPYPSPKPKLELEEVIGLTTKDGNGLSADSITGDCVYLAGCVVVVHNLRTDAQSHLLLSSRMPKPLSCLAVSNRDGVSCIAAGESGNQPAVLIWEHPSRSLISELKGHRFGVSCIDFSPNGKHLVSVGFSQDGYICVWDWRCGRFIAKVKVSTSCCSISSVCFSSDGGSFITAAKHHLNLWTIFLKSQGKTGMNPVTVKGKPVNLGRQKGSSFVSVVSVSETPGVTDCRAQPVGPYPIFALTDAGVLCLIHSGFSLKKWVDLQVDKGFALSVSKDLIACACSDGIVQLFTVEDLKYVGSLFYSEKEEPFSTSALSYNVNPDNETKSPMGFPDAIACRFTTSEKLVVIYRDHSLHVWDVHEIPKVSRRCILVSHSDCIWDVKGLPCRSMHDPALAFVARGVPFATCSADGTIRLWDFSPESDMEKNFKPQIALKQSFPRPFNIHQVGTIHLEICANVEAKIHAQGYRSMAVSSDGNYLAAGDCQGNLHLYNLWTSEYICFREVHHAEILSLSFSNPSKTHPSIYKEQDCHYLLASGGRDHCIHVYNVKRNFDLIRSLDDHSAAVTSVKFTCNTFGILSCSADGSLLFHDLDIKDDQFTTCQRYHQMASNGIVYDMAVDPLTNAAVTVGQDKKINTFDIASGKLDKTFRLDPSLGDPIKVTMDPSGSFVLCSCSQRYLGIYDFANGEILSQATGHAEVITGFIFSPDCKHVVSVSGDSCIFIWRLPTLLSSTMLQKVTEHNAPPSEICLSDMVAPSEGLLHESVCHHSSDKIKNTYEPMGSSGSDEHAFTDEVCKESPAFKFSISRLPKWAQNQVTGQELVYAHPEFNFSEKECVPLAGNCKLSSEPSGVHTPLLNFRSMTNHHATTSGSPMSSVSLGNSLHITCNIDAEKRWHTIHTVCLDLFASPELRDVSNAEALIPMPNLKGSEICVGTTKDVENGREGHQADNLFLQHLSNSSTSLKVEDKKSSARLSFSARFVVSRDKIIHCKRLFEMSDLALGEFSCFDEAVNMNLSQDLKDHISNEQCLSDGSHQGEERQNGSDFPNPVPSCCLMNEDSIERLETGLKETELQEKMKECKSALLRLDAIAEKVLRLFVELGVPMTQEDQSNRVGAELCDLASMLLPSITNRVQLLADLVNTGNICSTSDAKSAESEQPIEESEAVECSSPVF